LNAHKQNNLALLAAFILILIWGANFSVQKYLLDTLSPSGFLFARYLIMPACALIMMRITLGQFFHPWREKISLNWQAWVLLGTACMWALFVMASIYQRHFQAQ
jgi:drug/metabolite transporter (DMT)-like permease